MPTDHIANHQPDFQKVIEFLKSDIAGLRTGRANPAVVEGVLVDAYDAKTPLKGLASITAPDARSLLVDPWDKSLLKNIEKAIQDAKLGLNPAVQGQQIRIALPALTEESRKNLVKTLHEKLEEARKGVRNVRDAVKAEIVKAEKDKTVSEDDKYRLLEQLDRVAGQHNDKIKVLGDEKEREIMTI